jgi:hypothetical protein
MQLLMPISGIKTKLKLLVQVPQCQQIRHRQLLVLSLCRQMQIHKFLQQQMQ